MIKPREYLRHLIFLTSVIVVTVVGSSTLASLSTTLQNTECSVRFLSCAVSSIMMFTCLCLTKNVAT